MIQHTGLAGHNFLLTSVQFSTFSFSNGALDASCFEAMRKLGSAQMAPLAMFRGMLSYVFIKAMRLKL